SPGSIYAWTPAPSPSTGRGSRRRELRTSGDHNMTNTVGFIGLGAMGGPMALNLDPVKTERLRSAGAAVAESAEAVAAVVSRTICMVETTAQAEAVIAGEHGVIQRAKPGHIVACMSTIDPLAARRL